MAEGAVARLVGEHAERLRAAGVPTPDVDARLLAQHVLGDRLRDDALTSEARDRLDDLVARRAERIPLQQLTGETWFRWLRLACAPGVFVPRPETEIVAGVAIDEARTLGPSPLVVEPCTGTGAIALSVAAEVAGARVIATEVDDAAVALARRNLDALVSGRADVAGPARGASCEILQGDLLDPVDPALRGQVDVLVSNPPYLPASDRGSWEPEVSDHDPDRALVGGADGHEVVHALLDAATTWLRPGGLVVLEIDDRRGDDATAAAVARGLTEVRIVRDLTGADRAVAARRPPDHG